MRANRFTLKLAAILALGVALPARLWRELREVAGASSAERSFRRVAKTAVVLVAVVVLPSCVDGFATLEPVEDQQLQVENRWQLDGLQLDGLEGDALAWFRDVPEWFWHRDDASTRLLRVTEHNARRVPFIRGQLVAGIITPSEHKAAHAHLGASWARARLEMLKGPNGRAYAVWLNREKAPHTIYTVPNLVRMDKRTVETYVFGGDAPPAPRLNSRARSAPALLTSADQEPCDDSERSPSFTQAKAFLVGVFSHQGWVEIKGKGEQATIHDAEHKIELTVGSRDNGDPNLGWGWSEPAPGENWTMCQGSHERTYGASKNLYKEVCKLACGYAKTTHRARNGKRYATPQLDDTFGLDCKLVCGNDTGPVHIEPY